MKIIMMIFKLQHLKRNHFCSFVHIQDVSFTVAVYKVKVKRGQRVWEYLARLRSHRKSIRSLLFGVHLDSSEPRLLSLGRDRRLVSCLVSIYLVSRTRLSHSCSIAGVWHGNRSTACVCVGENECTTK